MSLPVRINKVTSELSILAVQYGERTPDYQVLVKEILATGAKAAIEGQFSAHYAKHLAAMTIAVLGLIEPEEPNLLAQPSE